MNASVVGAHTFGATQRWDRYSDDDHAVWSLLYQRRMASLASTASHRFLIGIDAIGLNPGAVPDLAQVNRRLMPLSGWQAAPVSGFIPSRLFFEMLSRRLFPTTVTVRPRRQLDYLPEPDIFHDVFGHCPLHADPTFADFLHRFGALAVASTDEDTIIRLARLFWFTVEFGLIRESGEVRIYGSGLISSAADAANALSPACTRLPFAVEAVFAQPFAVDRVQQKLFVIDSFEDLYGALDLVGK